MLSNCALHLSCTSKLLSLVLPFLALLSLGASQREPEVMTTFASARQEPFPTVSAPESTFPRPIKETNSAGPDLARVNQNPSGLAGLVDDARRLGALIGTGVAALAALLGLGTALVKAADKSPKSLKSIDRGHGSHTMTAIENPPIGVLVGIG